jgi:hypothetical protein
MTVPPIYSKAARVLEAIALENRLMRAGYPYDVILNMTLPEARLKAEVLGMLYG